MPTVSPKLMNWKRIGKIAVRGALVTLILAGALTGIGLLPGSVEAAYPGINCMCDSFNFVLVRDGRVANYMSAHPPAGELLRYEMRTDGSADVYNIPVTAGEPGKFIYRMRPHLWFTRFETADGRTIKWQVKRPMSARVREMIRKQEIKVVTRPNEDEVITTYYDGEMKELRRESKPSEVARKKEINRRKAMTMEKAKAEQNAALDQHPMPKQD